MAKEEKDIALSGEMLFDLESINSMDDKIKADVSILREASEHNINLNSLEEVDTDRSNSAVDIAQKMMPQESKIKGFWEDIDIKLSDAVNKIFNKSDRPFVVVRDNKIEYANSTFIKLLGLKSENDVLKEEFLSFVSKEDWNVLTENIAEMLTAGKVVAINMKVGTNRFHRIKFEAIYVNDAKLFSFVLVGERLVNKVNLISGLYDKVTGLPSFYLLEDRIQVAVNNENHRDFRLTKNKIALIGINIDNISEFKKDNLDDFVLRKAAAKLVMSLKKNYTVARGLKYHFWILILEANNRKELEAELVKIQALMAEPIQDDFSEHVLTASIGWSCFPDKAASAKKLLEQAVAAVNEAQGEDGAVKISEFLVE